MIDATDDYKLGPLYSFLSFTKNKQLYQENYLYFIIPGDTIFQEALFNEIFLFMQDYLPLIQNNPLIFFRKIRKGFYKQGNQSKVISVADIEKEDKQNFLKRIEQIKVSEIPSSETINQIIPMLASIITTC